MAFTVDQLLLTTERKAQLTAALANLGVADPLAVCIEEAQQKVAFYIAGYTVAEETQRPWIRAIALYKAYEPAESGIPEDIKDAYKSALEELAAVRDGKFPGLVADPDAPVPASAGNYGGSSKIKLRG